LVGLAAWQALIESERSARTEGSLHPGGIWVALARSPYSSRSTFGATVATLTPQHRERRAFVEYLGADIVTTTEKQD